MDARDVAGSRGAEDPAARVDAHAVDTTVGGEIDQHLLRPDGAVVAQRVREKIPLQPERPPKRR